MEARKSRAVPAATLLVFLLQFGVVLSTAQAARYKTTNFVVTAPSQQLAKEIGDAAEKWRRHLAIEWLGSELPPWSKPCPIAARVAPNLGAGGATSFVFHRGEVGDWTMNIQGSRERILDSVLPHEITHTVFASHFRRPLPRWADEGACTTVEHRSEIAKQERMLIDFLKTGRGISFTQMFAMKEYPEDVMPLYAQGHSTATWLIEQRGRQAFLDFLDDGMKDENWQRAVHQHYGFENLYAMQNAWLDWVKVGRPRLTPDASLAGQYASQSRGRGPSATPSEQAIYRGQSPDRVTPVAADEFERPAPEAPVRVVAADGSVYAAAAAEAERKRLAARATVDVPQEPVRSVYDASIDTGVLRR